MSNTRIDLPEGARREERFERTYGYFRPIVGDVVEKYLDCGNPRCGSAHPISPTKGKS